MEEAENQDVNLEAVAPSAESHGPEASHNETASLPREEPEDDKEKNFRALREEVKRLKDGVEEERAARRALETLLDRQSKPPQPEEDPLAGVEPDDWTTYSQNAILAERKARAVIQEELQKIEAKRAQEELPKRIKEAYPDFDAVVTKENVDYLRKTKPHIAAALAQCQDAFSQAASAYEYIKAFVGGSVSDDRRRAEENAKKPGTAGNVGSPALAQAKAFERGLNPELQKNLYAEMVEASRKISSR